MTVITSLSQQLKKGIAVLANNSLCHLCLLRIFNISLVQLLLAKLTVDMVFLVAPHC